MRLLLILNIIISASLLTGNGDVFASIATHKVSKVKKHRLTSAHKHKGHQGPSDIWERIRMGMQIPRPSPVTVDLSPTPAQALDDSPKPTLNSNLSENQSALDTPLPYNALSPARLLDSSQCEPADSANLQLKKLALLRKIDSVKSAANRTRVHARLELKPKAHKLYISDFIENLSPDDDIEAQAILAELENEHEKTGKLPPCTNSPVENLADAAVPEKNIEELQQQALRYERVNKYIIRYTQNPGFLAQVTERARPYLYHIVESLSKSKMPMELALLPIVESAYQPKAESPKQAAGLWQFIPSTGQDFNLDQSVHYDDRLDIIASTKAAIRFLSILKQHFNGDWLLALAAYNCGQGTVDEAIKRNRANGIATDYWSLQLPEETQGYVPRLLALSSILANPSNYKLRLAKIKNEPYFVKVNVAQEIDIKHLIDKDFREIAKLANLSPDQFSLLNPGYLSDTLNTKHPFTFLIPVSNAKQLSQRLRMLAKMATEEEKTNLPFSYVTTSLTEPAMTQFSSPLLSLDLNKTNAILTHANGNETKPVAAVDNQATNVSEPEIAALNAISTDETTPALAKPNPINKKVIRTTYKVVRRQSIRVARQLKIPKKLDVVLLDKKLVSGSPRRRTIIH